MVQKASTHYMNSGYKGRMKVVVSKSENFIRENVPTLMGRRIEDNTIPALYSDERWLRRQRIFAASTSKSNGIPNNSFIFLDWGLYNKLVLPIAKYIAILWLSNGLN